MQATDGTRLSYSYDEHNNIQSYTAKKNGTTLSTASYTYTDEGLPLTATVSAEYADIAYNYDSLNRLTSFEHEINGDIISTKYVYKNGTQSGTTTGQVSAVRYRYDGYSFGPHDDYTYTYDKNGNIVQITNGSLLISYTYDELNRLVREDNQQINKTVTYTYDTGGNILNKKEYAYTTGTLGEVVDTITYTYDSTWKDKLLTYDGGTTITYDDIGNPLTYNGYTFTWQKGRQLASASGNGNTITYKYGADGLRTEKTVNGVATQYTYLSGQLVAQTDGANTLTFTYTADGIPRTVNYNGTDYYYLYNLQGDVIAIYDRNGNSRVNYVYDSWGKIISVSGTLATTLGALNPFRYRGYVCDTETGFYYLTTRYYDPDTGRFLNADGYISTGYTISGYNMFAYCLNNPLVYIDSGGNRPSVGIGPEIDAERQLSCATESASRTESRKLKSDVNIVIVNDSYLMYIFKDKKSADAFAEWGKRNTVVVVDDREADNFQIVNSYLITDYDLQLEICNAIYNYNENYPTTTNWDRQVEPMVTEWQWHNTFYSVANALGRIGSADRFGSVDLDEYPGCNLGFGTQIAVTTYYYVKAWWKGMKDN